MRFTELEKGEVFHIDGAPYLADIIGERIVVAFVLEDVGGELMFKYDPADLAGESYLTTAFSDLRFDKNNLTDFERQCDEDLKNLL